MKPIQFVWLVPMLLATGCATQVVFPEPTASWQSFSGQLQYVTKDHRVIGEFVASRQGDDFRLDFTKGGSVPLIKVARHGEAAMTDGPMSRGHWQGAAGKAPGPLRGWAIEVPRAFSGLAPIIAAAKPASGATGEPRRMEIQGAQPGERFVFVFSR